MSHFLYHCFSRARRHEIEPALNVLQSIIRDGLYLSKEAIEVKWKDPLKSRNSISISQYRICFTSLNDEYDLRNHCDVFGPVGIGFKIEFVRALGGFPVFYLPAPIQGVHQDAEDGNGVSLLYRLAEVRSVLDRIEQLPQRQKTQIYSEVADIEELLGAIRFLGNLFYFTDYTVQNDTEALRYYRQREWRIIAGIPELRSSHIPIFGDDGRQYYAIPKFKGIKIHNYISDVVVKGSQEDANKVAAILMSNHININPRLI